MAPTIIGEMKESEELFHVFEWQIRDFASIPAEVDEVVCSPWFNFAGERWKLVMYPNGEKETDSEGYIDLSLKRESPGHVIELKFTLGLKTSNNEIAEEVHCTNDFDAEFSRCGWYRFLKRSKLLEESSELVPSGHLTLICRMRQSESIYAANLESVCQDFKKVLLDGSNHDLILKVGDTEFRAHRDILKARSQVFYSMLSHDMAEKNSEAIEIPDCDPEAMKLFLMHVYCGKVEGLGESNMLGLFYLADKYDMKNLKEECHNFIKMSLSATNFCDIFQLALNHSDSSLLEYATEYFLCNTLDILQTVEWQSFLKTNSTVANELFIKSHKQKK